MPLLHQVSAILLLGVLGCGGKSLQLDGSGTPLDPNVAAGGADSSAFLPQPSALSIAVDQSRLYWTTGWTDGDKRGHVRSCLTASCADSILEYDASTTHVADRPFEALAIDGNSVYWSSRDSAFEDSIKSCPLAGCVNGPRILASTSTVASLASDGADLYFATDDPEIWRCSVAGCEKPELFAKIQGSQNSIAVDSRFVYWIDGADYSNAAIVRSPKDGSGPPTTLVSELNQPRSLSVNSRYLIFTTFYSVGDVAYCPLSGCAGHPSLLASAQRYPFTIVSDEQAAYWTDKDAVQKGALDGSLAVASWIGARSDANWPPLPKSTIAVDGAFVYWLSCDAPESADSWQHMSIKRRPK